MTGPSADAVASYWLRKGREALQSAKDDQKAKRLELATSRAYFAAFSAATAVFLLRGKRFRKHSGLRAAIHSDLVKRDLIDPALGRAYNRLFENRHRADYDDLPDFNADHVAKLIAEAGEFVAEMEKLAET